MNPRESILSLFSQPTSDPADPRPPPLPLRLTAVVEARAEGRAAPSRSRLTPGVGGWLMASCVLWRRRAPVLHPLSQGKGRRRPPTHPSLVPPPLAWGPGQWNGSPPPPSPLRRGGARGADLSTAVAGLWAALEGDASVQAVMQRAAALPLKVCPRPPPSVGPPRLSVPLGWAFWRVPGGLVCSVHSPNGGWKGAPWLWQRGIGGGAPRGWNRVAHRRGRHLHLEVGGGQWGSGRGRPVPDSPACARAPTPMSHSSGWRWIPRPYLLQ